jgi:DNA-binding transcriptional regulator GbsR (MarR family)
MEEKKDKIEKKASLLEKLGMSPVAARVYLYFFYSDDYSATFDELQNYFKVSKSAVSNALKYLELLDMISAGTRDGQRKRYFSISIDGIINSESAIKKIVIMKNLFKQIGADRRELKNNDDKISEIIAFYEMFESEMSALLDKWKENRK